MRSQRVWLPVVMVAASLAGGALVNVGVAQQQPRLATEIQQAEAFIVLDRDGKARAILNATPDGAVALTLRDAEGRDRLRMRTGPDGGSDFAMLDATGRESIRLDGTGVRIWDAAGRLRSWLRLDRANNPSLVLLDEKQQGRAVLGCATFSGGDGGRQRPESSLLLLDERQSLVFEAP